jgi:uncharacterized protein (DUF952 family)
VPLIYKVVHAAEWVEAERTRVYCGSAKDREDGFLHFSTAEQLRETLARYYTNATDLVLVAADPALLGDRLKWEHAASRGENFAHLYGPLQLDLVIWSRQLERDSAGNVLVDPPP